MQGYGYLLHVDLTSGRIWKEPAGDYRHLVGGRGLNIGLLYRLKRENPDREFYSLGYARACFNMKKTTLALLYRCLESRQFEILLPEDTMRKARAALERMVEFT